MSVYGVRDELLGARMRSRLVSKEKGFDLTVRGIEAFFHARKEPARH